MSWRAGAFDGVPYYSTWAVWRDRLFVWTVLLGSLVLIAIGIRLARPLARRAGILGDRYGSPFPIEARWIFSLYGGTR
jgi:glucose dehydrogenase